MKSKTPPLRAVHRWGPLCGALMVAAVLSTSAQLRSDEYSYGGDTLESRSQEGRRTTILRGHARLHGEGLTVTGDIAFHYEWLDQFLVRGNVAVVSDSLSVWADSLRIYEAEDAGEAMGHVRVESADGALGTSQRGFYRRQADQMSLMGDAQVIQGDFVVKGDSILLDRPRNRMEAYGKVKLVDEGSSTVVEGEHAVFDRQVGVAIVDSLPHLTSRRQGPEATTVTSDWMSFREDGEWSRAIGGVEFQQGGTSARADTATFVGEDLLVLTGLPQVDRQRRLMMGDEIHFVYENKVLRRIEVFGQAQLVDSTPDTLAQDYASIPLQNVLSGDSLSIYVDGGMIRRTHVVGNASSTYLPEDQQSAISVNEVTGNSVDIEFAFGRVHRVQVDGNVKGTYQFLERGAEPDSAAADSLAMLAEAEPLGTPPDSAAAEVGPENPRLIDFDSSADRVGYSGEKVVFWVEDGRIDIHGHAKVEHGTLGLAAGRIQFDTENRELLAEDDPLLTDKDSELVGDRMGYLFDPQTGAVAGGATKFDDGYYTGKHIRRIDRKTLLVQDGTYTACDLAEPHYHFSAKRMKLKIGEQVVARQVTFHVSNIPLLTLPFYYKSLDSGRHSGILFPNVNLGVSSREGRFVRDLGYYWATNDYTDFKFELDYNERNDATFTIDNRYNVRYGLSGSARFDYLRRFSRTQTGDEWKLNANHRQPHLFDVWNATASVRLSSSSITTNNLSSDSRNELIDTQLHSTGALSRTYDNGMSMNVSVVHDQFVNAEDDDKVGTDNVLYRQTLPRLTLGVKTRPLLGPLRSGDGNVVGNVLRDIQFSQGYGGQLDRERREESRQDQVSANGRWGLSYAPKGRLGPFVATSSASFAQSYTRSHRRENVYELREVVDPGDSSVVEVVELVNRVDETSEDIRPSLSFSNSLRTDLYGIFDTHLGPVRGIKHKVSWSMSHNWRPQLGSRQESSQNFAFNLTNELSLKVLDTVAGERTDRPDREALVPENDDGQEERTKKLDQLVRWSLSTSYDPDAAIDRRWSTINSSVVIRPGVTQAVSLDVSQSIDPYSFAVLSTRVQTGLSLRGSLGLGGRLREPEQPKNLLIDRLPSAEADTVTAAADSSEVFDDFYDYGDPRANPWLAEGKDLNAIPWSFNTRASLVQSKDPFSGDSTTRATVTTNASVRLPGQWQLSYSAGFDVDRGEFTNQFWSLRRDIHLWSLEFNRGITDGSDFGFRLYLRDLPDLELKRGQRNAGDMLGRLNQF